MSKVSHLFWISTNPKEYNISAPREIIVVAVIAMLWKVLPIPPTPNSSRVFLVQSCSQLSTFYHKPCKKVVIAINPKPPDKSIMAKKIWPNIFKSAPTSIIVNPVTVIAEVDVKKASHKPTFPDEHKGELKIKVPKKIIINPVTIVNWGTDNFLYSSFNL